MTTTADLHNKFEPNPSAEISTANKSPPRNVSDVDYESHPSESISISPAHTEIIDSITCLYSGSASESDMGVNASKAIYDDPFSYSDTRYKIAGQWYGIPKLFASSKTLKTKVVKDSTEEIIFKLQQEYTLKAVHASKTVNSLVSLALDEQKKVRYHKDMWNEKDCSHEGLGKVFKQLNGDHLTKITMPPKEL